MMIGPVADRLDCTVMPYAWGSRTAIARLQGRTVPSAGPEAELWMGAHATAPSRLVRSGVTTDLAAVIARDPERELGAAVARRFGPRLPFLLKVLAAERPLSLQAHPTSAQARAGYAEEERRRVPLLAPDRNYRDPYHKPELLCALTSFDAFCGFRRADETLELAGALAVPALNEVLAPLDTAPAALGLAAIVRGIMALDQPAAGGVVEAVVAACRTHRGRFVPECQWAMRLADEYPGDRGVLIALLLNLVRLRPGEAVYLDAGQLHAYLQGVGIEIMSSSDNVLRGGLTNKHVDMAELLRVLSFADAPLPVRWARPVDANEVTWDTPTREFRLSRLRVSGEPAARTATGPEVLLCVDGTVHLRPGDGTAGVDLPQGASAFVPASNGSYQIEGTGVLFRATVNI
jgi:mannose-6-phosphate isomerase